MPPYRPWQERLTEKVDVRGPDECWPWLAGRGGYQSRPYFAYKWEGGKRYTEHAARTMYRLHYEEPGDRHIHHTCENRDCLNPAHLLALPERQHYRVHERTHCPRNHPFNEENTYIDKRGYKNCRACFREKAAERRARNRSVRPAA